MYSLNGALEIFGLLKAAWNLHGHAKLEFVLPLRSAQYAEADYPGT